MWESLRHEPPQSIIYDAICITDLEFKRSLLRTATRCYRENLCTQADADNWFTLVQHPPGQPDLRFQRGQVTPTRAAPGAAAHQEQAVTDIACLRDRTLLGERPEVPETNAPPFQVVFHQAKIVG